MQAFYRCLKISFDRALGGPPTPGSDHHASLPSVEWLVPDANPSVVGVVMLAFQDPVLTMLTAPGMGT